ncbi:GNAT family N-acetyltransferase [Streptomyces sp. BE20]|uniref:GNAT family N-acetyltransferase n=1 Tax=Streptomycetaceae TaxID=2062 RepID=UPI002E78C56B|nr:MULTISPECIES: GNAT family N-acetyltransferase [unclassified Streptomyces]MED7950938.1 GNAT family N-acetyltransferase [Streptomyces sp. BE303]MEE1824861.1 GNAT family N-acetyltransferase [Streptomyces sp. BE20]
MSLTDLHLERHTAAGTAKLLPDLIAVYAQVYDVPPYQGDPFFTPEAFQERLLGAMEMPGFECVTARDGGVLIGYLHGVTLPEDRTWWLSVGEQRPDDVLKASQAGDVFWLRELMVLPIHTNKGVGRRLHDEAVIGRGQQWTTLTCIPTNQPAHDAYLRWGYKIIGQIKHAPDSPVYNAMVLPVTALLR